MTKGKMESLILRETMNAWNRLMLYKSLTADNNEIVIKARSEWSLLDDLCDLLEIERMYTLK